MAHYAQVNESNIVTRVIVVSNEDEPTESDGILFCEQLTGESGWVKTSYNATIRKNFAGIGFTWDESRNAFIPPKPYSSWVLDESTCRWGPPVAMPESGGPYQWNEEEQTWDEIV